MANNIISVKAPAKINLFLEILGKRSDGFHELETVMQEIDLADNLRFEETGSGIRFNCENNTLLSNKQNLVYKAAELILNECDIKKGVSINLEKVIPVGAGLGGGSSDAASTLKALNTLWKTGLNDNELMELAAGLGSDVPFFITGKTSICKGRGEKIYPIEVANKLNYLVIFPNLTINTVTIYKNLKFDLTKKLKDVSFLANELAECDVFKLGKLLFNRLEQTVFQQYPGLMITKGSLSSLDFCGLLVSGSGSSIYGLCKNRIHAEELKKEVELKELGDVFLVASEII